MSSSGAPMQVAANALLNDEQSIAAADSSPAGIISLVQKEANLLSGPQPPDPDIFPIRCLQPVAQWQLAGDPKIEKAFHSPLAQGKFHDKGIGDANSYLQARIRDLDDAIQRHLDLNRLAIDGKLSDKPRAIKYADDSIKFIKKVKGYITEVLAVAAALKANLQFVQATEARMLSLIDNNLASLQNLLNEICNWGLPPTLSLAGKMNLKKQWSGFQWNKFAGFSYKQFTSIPNFNFSFSACQKLVSDWDSLFNSSAPTSLVIDDGTGTTLMAATPLAPLNGHYGDPTQFTNPTYIATMQTTTTPVYNPDAPAPLIPTSLPPASSIISNYSLPASTYDQNIVSAVPALNSIVVQPGDQDYGTSPSASRLASLRSLLIEYVTLDQVVNSQYDPNLTAAWLIYLDLNRQGRGGTWIQNFAIQYTGSITPSVTYLKGTPVPWNQVLGGTGVVDGPAAIPLIPLLQADTTNNLKWRLTYIEASLLGYQRSHTWDSAQDSTYLADFTGSDLDYVATTITTIPTVTEMLGQGTAVYPVTCTLPQSIQTKFDQVVVIATQNIALATTYQSVRPQNRFTYNVFAQATLVDRFTQFWRDFNLNLVALLAGDSYTLGFVVNYILAFDSAVDPLGNPAVYNRIKVDAGTRSRTWTPGSVLPPVPSVPASAAAYTLPTNQTNGWTSGSFDATAFLSRPDIQAQTLPVQVAMLSVNQSYSALMTQKTRLQAEVSRQMTNAQNVIAASAMPGWEVETAAAILVPPGAMGIAVTMPQVDSDQTNYVTDSKTITIQTAGTYLVYVELDYDPTGPLGTYNATLMLNGAVASTGSTTAVDDTTFTAQVSTELNLEVGDTLMVVATHSLANPVSLLTGSSFLGLLESSAQPTPATVVADDSTSTALAVTSLTAATTGPMDALMAVTILGDGAVAPVDPTVVTPGVTPYCDGITITAAASAGVISVATSYGAIYTVGSADFTPGGLLYIAADGSLTQDYSALTTEVRWIMCVGKALSETTFLFQPHMPINYIQNF